MSKKIKIEKKAVTITFPKEVYGRFQEQYPECLHRFCRRALFLAAYSREFFEKVFFDEWNPDTPFFDYHGQ